MSMVALATSFAFAGLAAPAIAQAQDTVWICKPGQADDLCAGTIEGETLPPPGQTPQPLGYTRPANPPVDCFYLYPTVSTQAGPNADLAKDGPIRRVVVQQARMFSTICDVYAPMYRQVTLNGDQSSHNAQVETAYQSAKAAFQDYLKNENAGRGFIMLGHSQGSAHTARLIDELVDKDPELRQRFVGAIAPGANIAVPIGKPVGGLFANVPACTLAGEIGCVTAFSTYNDVPGPTARFSRVDTGYWIYPVPRFSSATHEVMCTNPAVLDGGSGALLPLVNFDYLTSAPPAETAAPWRGQPDYYRGECKRQDGSHWLNISKVGTPGDARPDLGAAVAEGSNYHVPEVNLAEANLLKVAQLQTDAYGKEQARVARLQRKLKTLNTKIAASKRRIAARQKQVKKLSVKLRQADGIAQRRVLKRKLTMNRKQVRVERKKIRSLRRQVTAVKKQLA